MDLDFSPLPSPRQWQLEAYNQWTSHNYRGTIKSSTGTGKSMLAYMAMQQLRPRTTLIVVPTIHLQNQHKKMLMTDLGIAEQDIGLVGAGSFDITKPIVIAVVNSIRYDKLKDVKFELLIMDEFHRYPPEANRTFMLVGSFDKVMALSATPEREDELHIPFLKIFPLVYEYNQHEAIADKVLANYRVINIGIKLKGKDLEQYIYLNKIIERYYPIIDFTDLPWQAKKAISKRKRLLQASPLKIDATVKLVKWEIQKNVITPKMLIFNEFIESAETLKEKLSFEGIKSEVYHSAMKLEERKDILDAYKKNEFKILIAVKALDEGVNVPDTEVAIIVSGSSSKRQYIQRVGRILRKKEDKEARVYQFYIKDTQEEKWLHNRMRTTRNVTIQWY